MKQILLILVFFAILNTSCADNSKQIEQAKNESKSFYEYISNVPLPDNLEWCGEKIPLDDDEVRERAEREYYLLLQQPGQIMLYLKRSGRYFPLFEKLAKEYNMPDDIKYLSVAESALFMARSSKDAVGLWQIIPATAKSLGLEINEFVDERRNPYKSTIAGFQYLKNGYSVHKSWILTAAGYNMGHFGVSENVSYQNQNDYFDLYLNEETSRYIFRIALIKEIMQNAEKYGFKVKEDEKYQAAKTKIVRVTSEISSISEWAISQGTTYKDVKVLNPWILKRTLPKPSKGYYEIEIPA